MQPKRHAARRIAARISMLEVRRASQSIAGRDDGVTLHDTGTWFAQRDRHGVFAGVNSTSRESDAQWSARISAVRHQR
jgi:hypothetical protein